MNRVLMGVAPPLWDTPLMRGSQRLDVPEARELLEANLALIRRLVAFTCRHHRFTPEEAEDFASSATLKLVENDYAVLRAWEGRSSLSTYLSIVVQRWALDHRTHEWGKWHPSAEAKRMGAIAVELEQIVVRDGRTIEEAFPFLAAKEGSVTLDSLRQMAARFPRRAAKRHDVPVEEAEEVATAGSREIEDQARSGERRRTAERVAGVVREALAAYSADDRLILQLRFVQGMTVAQIARALQRDQKLLYRRIERCLADIRAEAHAAGLADEDLIDLVGRDDVFLDFDLGNGDARPSKQSDETVATAAEDPE